MRYLISNPPFRTSVDCNCIVLMETKSLTGSYISYIHVLLFFFWTRNSSHIATHLVDLVLLFVVLGGATSSSYLKNDPAKFQPDLTYTTTEP